MARGESEALMVWVLVDSDLTLYTEEAGTFVIIARILPGMLRLISKCLNAISNDFFDRDLPKPELSWETDNFPDVLSILET